MKLQLYYLLLAILYFTVSCSDESLTITKTSEDKTQVLQSTELELTLNTEEDLHKESNLIASIELAPETSWELSMGKSNFQSGQLIKLNDGNLLVGSGTREHPGILDAYSNVIIRKISMDRKVLWEAFTGNYYPVTITSVCETKSGNIYVSGNTEYEPEDMPPTKVAFLTKIAANGEVLWTKYLEEMRECHAITTVNDNHILLLGSFYNAVLLEMDEEGSSIWIQDYKTITAAGNSIVRLNDGYAFVGAVYTKKNNTPQEGAFGNYDYAVIKVDKNGKEKWLRFYGGTAADFGQALIKTEKGFIVAGNSYSLADGNKKALAQGKSDIWVIGLDNKGFKLWEKSCGGDEEDKVNNIYSLSDGNFLLVGESGTQQSSTKKSWNHGGNDGWMVCFNPMGSILWDKTVGYSNYDAISSVIEIEPKNYLACLYMMIGPSESELVITSISENNKDDSFEIEKDPNKRLMISQEEDDDTFSDDYKKYEWYGLFNLDNQYTLKKATLTVEEKFYNDSTNRLRKVVANEGPAVFFVAGIQQKADEIIPHIPFSKDHLENEEEFTFQLNSKTYTIWAEGIKGKWGYERYSLYIKGEKEGKEITQRFAFAKHFDDAIFRFLWIGDLDLDGMPDLLMNLSPKYSYSNYSLWLSSEAKEGELIREFGGTSSFSC